MSPLLTSLLLVLGLVLTASPGRYTNTGRAAYLRVSFAATCSSSFSFLGWPICTRTPKSRGIATTPRRVLLRYYHTKKLDSLALPQAKMGCAATFWPVARPDTNSCSGLQPKLVFLVLPPVALCCPRRHQSKIGLCGIRRLFFFGKKKSGRFKLVQKIKKFKK